MALRMLETRSRTRPAFKLTGVFFSSAGGMISPGGAAATTPSSKLPRRLSRGLGLAEYALWKSVSESSVVPVSAGVRAGVTGVGVSRTSGAGAGGWSRNDRRDFIRTSRRRRRRRRNRRHRHRHRRDGLGVHFLVKLLYARRRSGLFELGRDGAPGGVDRVRTGDRGLAGRDGVGPFPFPGALVALPCTPEDLRERGRDMAGRPSVPSLSLSWLEWAFHCLSRSAASAFSNYKTATQKMSARELFRE
jgi:hypothetical protein